MTFRSFATGQIAVVAGAAGGIGAALAEALEGSGHFDRVIRLSRRSEPPLDIENEATIREAAGHIASIGVPALIVDATGFLHGGGIEPEKTWRSLDSASMLKSFAINAIGPALLMKHLLPLLPRAGKSVFATLSARVGGIADNRLGGWYSYRASKAALNQIVRTAAVELRRGWPDAVCVALHPGTVATQLSGPFAKAGLDVQTPSESAEALLACLDRLVASDSGGFFDRSGERLPW